MAGKKRTDQPRDIGDDQQAGMHPGENFQPRNRGEGADAKDRAAAEESRRLNAAEDETVNPGSLSQTAWEGRVERGEEWMEEQVPEREARGDEEPNSEVSRRGLVNPPPEE
ncbi:MAG TPA: hypothetical protein VK539_24820 [Myxococcaceae bacterium]|nr:hypothetical protein [Myxococcaceae bacterium]